jgi:hypothetical protein
MLKLMTDFQTPTTPFCGFSLASLPAELVIHVANFLPPVSRLALALTSHAMHHLCAALLPRTLRYTEETVPNTNILAADVSRAESLHICLNRCNTDRLDFLFDKLESLRELHVDDAYQGDTQQLVWLAEKVGDRVEALSLKWFHNKSQSLPISQVSVILLFHPCSWTYTVFVSSRVSLDSLHLT